MKIYTIAYKKIIDAFERRNPEHLLGRKELDRAGAFLREEDRLRFLAARYLTIWLLEKKPDNLNLPLSFDYTSYGKPYLGLNEVFLNWSHSGEFISLATAKRPVGVDIECHCKIERAAARYICCNEEWEKMDRLEGSVFLTEFYRLWTAKESLLKAKGIGLGMEPSRLKITYTQTGGSGWQATLGQTWYGNSRTFTSGTEIYTVSSCSGEKDHHAQFEFPANL